MAEDILPRTMQAWVCPRYGDPSVLRLERVSAPQVGPQTVLVRMLATTVSSADARIRACRLPPGIGLMGRLALGWNGPRRAVLGSELVGEVAAVGAQVSRFTVGERVIAFPDTKLGAHAEFVAISEDGKIAPCPADLPLEQAASLCFGGTTALHFLRRARSATGERLLVIGASGAVGSAMVQLAGVIGMEVDAVCSAGNVATVEALGADRVIDYAKTDFRRLGESWDVIADCVAASDFCSCVPVLRPGGRYLPIAGGLLDLLALPRGGRKSIAAPVKSDAAMIAQLVDLAVAGRFAPLVGSVHTFADLPEAHRLADSGRKRGSAVVLAPPPAR